MNRSVALMAALALTLITTRDAAAGSPGWWPSYMGGSIYTSGVRGLPPYFSLFPPVYYSYPVPRTYGYSPFAYPFGSPTPEVTITEGTSQMMINPYVPRTQPAPASPAPTSAEKTVGGPQTIVNPFVQVQLARQGE